MVFYEKPSFTRSRFRDFMFAQSKSYPGMIELSAQLKRLDRLKIVVVSNESREVNAHRIRKFKLDQLADTFISSGFVRMRKPNVEILRLALDFAQTPIEQFVFIENTAMFVQIAEGLGMRGILRQDSKSTCAKLASLGLAAGSTQRTGNGLTLVLTYQAMDDRLVDRL